MATSVVPALIDALVSTFTSAITTARVYDGFGSTEDPGDFLMVGVEDPDLEGSAFAADVTQDWTNANTTARSESGDITCAALSWNGNTDQKAARDAVYAVLAAAETALRNNPSVGLANVLWTSFGTNLQLSQNQTTTSALAMVIFRIHFEARI